MTARREDIDNYEVRYMYEVDDMTQQSIADYYGVSRSTIYFILHPEKQKENNDNSKEARKRYWQSENGKEVVKAVRKRYRQTDKGKEYIKRHSYKRRDLGFISLNKPFLDSEGHHIDEKYVIYIPKDVHHSICHNVRNGEGMLEMNTEAINFWRFEYTEKVLEETGKIK